MSLVAAMMMAIVVAPAASAAPKLVDRFIGGPISEGGGTAAGEFSTPKGVAVNDATADGNGVDGWLYVSDDSNHRVQVFNAAGVFQFMIGRNVIKSSPAVNTDLGDVFEKCTHAVDCQAGSAGLTTDGPAGELDNPQGLAINQANGHVYVRDRDNRRMQEFTADGQFVRMWGWDVVSTGAANNVGTAAFEVCDATNGNTAADCKQGISGANGGQFATTSLGINGGVVVDPAAPHDVFVADPQSRRVQEFTANGGFVRTWGWDVLSNGSGTANGDPAIADNNEFEICASTTSGVCKAGVTSNPVGQNGSFNTVTPNLANIAPGHLAIDGATGVLYAGRGAAGQEIFRFDTDETTPGALLVASPIRLTEVAALTAPPTIRGLAVEPSSGGLFVADGETRAVYELAGATSGTPTLEDTHLAGSGVQVASLAFNAVSGELLGAWNPSYHRVFFADDDGAPAAGMSVLPATNVETGTASVSAEVDSTGQLSSSYRLEVSRNGVVWETVGSGTVAAGAIQTVSATASALLPNTLYRYRVVTAKQFGNTEVASAELTLLTDAAPPQVRQTAAQEVTDTTARLTAQINPNSTQTSYHLEWGQGGFTHTVPVPDASVGPGPFPVPVSQSLTGLSPNTTYQYRFVATSVSEGITTGPTRTFTTLGAPDASGRAYELVTTEKVGGQGVGFWPSGIGHMGSSGFAAYRGERFAAQAQFGATLSGENAFSHSNDWAFVERADSSMGWVSRPPLSHPNNNANIGQPVAAASVAEDLSAFYWTAPSTLAFFPEMVADADEANDRPSWANFAAGMLSDWGSSDARTRWEPFGPSGLPQVANTSDLGQLATLFDVDLSADGSTAVATTLLTKTGRSQVHGLAGDADPTWPSPANPAVPGVPAYGDLTTGRSIYVGDLSGGLTDAFPGGERVLASVCTGTPGVDRTTLPGVVGGDLVAQECSGDTERQWLLISGTGGTFTLTYDGQTTAALAYDASTGTVQAALEDLSNLDAGDVTVTGGPGDASASKPYVVKFGPSLGDVPSIVIDSTALTGGSTDSDVRSYRVPTLLSSRGAAFGIDGTVRGAQISEDGSRLFFLSPDPVDPDTNTGPLGAPPAAGCTGSGATLLCAPQLFVRQRNADGSVVTRWISKAVPALFGQQDATLTGQIRVEGASKDGSVVFFRANTPLTVDDPNGTGAPVPGGVKTGTPHPDSWDLYAFRLAPGNDPTGPGSSLTRISAGPTATGDCSSPKPHLDLSNPTADAGTAGALRFVSDDGTRAYFVCQAPLPGVTRSADGVTTPGGATTTTDQANLYLYDANRPSSERWTFVARLPRLNSSQDDLSGCVTTGTKDNMPFRAETGTQGDIQSRGQDSNCVRGTADGEFVTLFTEARLTADDAADEVFDVYGYDAATNELTRLTAPQDGDGASYPCTGDFVGSPQDESLRWSCRGDGGMDLQNASEAMSSLGVASAPTRSGDRVAFFQSGSRLTADDKDNGYDVYQWRDGELSLITSGAHESEDSLYKGNDETGRNLYFVTRDALTWQDSDKVADIYSARVGGGIAEPLAPPACGVLTGACQTAGSGVPAPATDTKTSSPSESENAAAEARKTLSVSGLSAKARMKASRSGRLSLTVRASSTGRVSLTVMAKLGKRAARVGGTSKRVSKGRAVKVNVRLYSAARKRLHSGKELRLTVEVRQSGARVRTRSILLPGVKS